MEVAEVTTVTGWHFAADKLRDGRPLPKAGDTLVHEGKVRPCESGLHASARALDALSYAPGFMVARVELRGTIVPHGEDKHAASERHYLTGYVDANAVVVKWAFAEADRAVRVHAVAALRSAADADGIPDEHRAVFRKHADDLAALPVVHSSNAARAASDAAGAASDAAWAASDAAWAASDAESNARLEAALMELFQAAVDKSGALE